MRAWLDQDIWLDRSCLSKTSRSSNALVVDGNKWRLPRILSGNNEQKKKTK